jgi:parallel beta-helix repeat protein
MEENRDDRDWDKYPAIVDSGGVYASGAENAILDGFRIKDNQAYGIRFYLVRQATVLHCTISGNSSGGVVCEYASPTVIDCTVTDNKKGGVVLSHVSSPTLIDCTIARNTAKDQYSYGSGGGLTLTQSSPTLLRCKVIDNVAGYGGGVHCRESSPVLMSCNISGNSAVDGTGGGISCIDSSPTLAACIIAANTASYYAGGLFCYGSSSPMLTSCVVAGNTAADSGGGLFCEFFSSPTLINCTVSKNAAADGSAIACDSVSRDGPSIVSGTNCIVWNGPDWLYNNDGSTIGFAYSDIQQASVYPGQGNINVDPLFVGPADGNFHLLEDSPCIDAGRSETDFNDACLPPGLGSLRNDMGAYGGPFNCGWPGSVPAPTSTPTPVLDLNHDHIINAIDLLRILEAWHSNIQPASPEDLFDDGMMNLMDLAIFGQHWEETTGAR